ncbi:MAG: hypothetical protein M3300_06930 [Actinomycetota bacterium]|nr:hypothetical protein [Actinomycetota bacterium]
MHSGVDGVDEFGLASVIEVASVAYPPACVEGDPTAGTAVMGASGISPTFVVVI